MQDVKKWFKRESGKKEKENKRELKKKQQIYKGKQECRHEFADRGKNGFHRQKSITSLWIRVICITIGFVKGKAQIQRIR